MIISNQLLEKYSNGHCQDLAAKINEKTGWEVWCVTSRQGPIHWLCKNRVAGLFLDVLNSMR